jgi:hypothetical protein
VRYGGRVPASPPDWSLDSLRLPKALDDDARAPALHAALRAHARPLWSEGTVRVPAAPWSEALAAVLANAHVQGQLVRGLEQVESVLQREAHGLSLVDARSGTTRGARVSRLLIVSADGTERFYRQVERLLRTQGSRLLAVRVDTGSAELAAVVPHATGVVRALMLEHKDSVTRALLAAFP